MPDTNKKGAPAEAPETTSCCSDSTSNQGNTITILETVGPCLTKVYKANGVSEDYGDAASFRVHEELIRDLKHFAEYHQEELRGSKRLGIIRGKFVGTELGEKANVSGTYCRTNANFTDQPLHLFMIDIDGYRPGFADPITDTEQAVLDFFTDNLSPAFQDCSFYWHLSSSAGMPGKEGVLKCHVWLWSKTPYTTSQMHAWAKTIGPAIDSAVYRRVQLHYVCDPIFEAGRIDPVPVRCGFHLGKTDYVDLVIDEATLAKARDQGSGEGGSDMVLKDPSEKDGLIGAFHKAFTAEDVLLNFLEGFEQVTERRYTWHDGGGTEQGVWVHDDGQHIGSSHNTWPIDGIANPAPSEAQIAAGNYQKGHVRIGPLDVSVENPVGTTRKGPGWETTMSAHYGYLKRTEGADGDQVDVYVKQGTPTDRTGPVYVIDQYDPKTGKFDEHKAMVGYGNQVEAIAAYDQHFSDGSGPQRRRGVVEMSPEAFKAWASVGDTKKPAYTEIEGDRPHALPETIRTALHRNGKTTRRPLGADGRSRSILAVRQAPEVPGLYRVSTQLVTVGERRLPLDRVANWDDAARTFSHLHRYAVEHLDALVTDAEGRPLATIGGFKGGTTYSSVSPGAVMLELARIEGATGLWLAHNHPSGLAELSQADHNLSKTFADILKDSGITYHGLAAITRNGQSVVWKNTDDATGTVPRLQNAPHRLPLVEREIVESEPGETVTSPAKAKALVAELAKDQPGVVFLTAQNQVAGFVPFDRAEMGELRRGDRLMRLFRAASQSGAVSAFVAMPDNKVTNAQFANLKGALGSIEVRVLDGIKYNSDGRGQMESLAEKGLDSSAGLNFFSQIDRDKRVASFNQAANQQLEEWAAGRLKTSAIIELGRPSSVLLKFGMPDLPMHLTQAVLRKAVTDKHDVDAADLKDITLNVQAPIAVFGSKRGEGHLVVVTEARHADGNIVVALDLYVQRDGIGINDVRSIHPKRDGSIAHWIADGLLLGLEKRKGRDWLENSAGSNSQQPQVKAALDKATIYDAGSIRNADPDGAQAQFDQLLFDMASAPWGDVRTILTSIEQGSANAFNRELASLLLSQNLATTTIQTAAFDGQHSGGYNPQTDVITIMQAADAEQTILHELMHASTVRALSNKSVAAGAMRSLLKEVRQNLGLDRHYGLTDVREFVAEAFTNPEFQEALRQIPVTASGIRGKLANAWGRFVATVRQLLGLDRDQETALGKALELGARLMQENQTAPLRGYMGEIIGNQAKPTRHLIGQATNQLHDLFANSGGTFNWLHKTVGTQYHKAQIDRHFAKVFGLGQQYLLDTSRFAMDAADKAPSLLMKLESLRDIFSAKAAKRSDVEAIADPLFAGTLENMVWSNAELRDRFGLNATQIKLFREARAAVGKSLDDLGISEMAQVTKAVLPGIDLERVKGADLVTARDYLHSTLNREADIQRLNGQEDTAKALESAAGDVLQKAKHIVDLKADGYVPMMRFGKFAVDVVGADGERQFFGMYETRREANQAARALQVAYPTAEVTQGQLDTETWRLFQGLDPSSLEVFAKALGAEEKAIYQDFLKLTINNRSAMKRLLAQKGTEGYSRDVQRILASFVTSNARLAAKNYHFGDLKQAVLDIPKVKGDVRNEAAKLVEYLQNPQEEAAGLRGYLFVHFLGGSVASALVNMTQPLTMTAPYLAQYGNAATALVKAGKLLASGRYDAELRDAMQLAEREGITSPHELHQLFAESMQTLGRNALVRRGLHAWGSFFALAEQFNRKLTFIAAFEMALQNGEVNPFAFAQKAVEETQGIYNRGNRPNWARGAIGATVFTFKQFSIAYVEFLRRLWRSDKRAFAIAMAILFVGAGAEGWPFAEDLEDLIDTVGQFAGFGTNSKAWLRENATKVFGELGGEIFRKGISALLPIDLSSRLGVQNLIPGSAMFKVSETDKTRDMLEFVGPFGGFVSAALRGFEAARTGDLAGAATMAAPVAIQNALKGQDMQAFGFYRDTKGRRVVDTDGYDAFAKAIGFQPNVVARESGKIREQQQNVAQHRAIESEIADLWAHGVFERDEAKVKDAVSRLKAWNERNPEMPIRIVPRQIGERVKAMALSREQRFAKSVPKEMRGMLQ